MSSNLVVLQANDLQQLDILDQGSTRLKVVCFDLSPSFVLLGANSGTIYVLDHESLQLKKQIPAGNGCVMELSISSDEQQVACALSCGTVMVFELQHGNTQALASSDEHYGHIVTTLVWGFSRPELYIGDKSGRITVLYVSKSKTGSLFKSSCLHLMTLESSIIQLDYHQDYLLVSTLIHTYVCNTLSETFTQVGTKLRHGEYGSCFCQVNHNDTSTSKEEKETEIELQSSVRPPDMFDLSDCYEALEEDKIRNSSVIIKDMSNKPASPTLMFRVFCARPGTRIWEADHYGKVLVTHQLKNALMVSPAKVIFIDGSYSEENLLEEINLSQKIGTSQPKDETHEKISSHEIPKNNIPAKVSHPSVSVTFTKILNFYNKYLLAISAYGLYLIDPSTTKILLWVSVSEGITDIKVSGNSIIYKSGSGCIQHTMITPIDIAILVLHSRKLFLECASLCLKNADAFLKSKFLSSSLDGKILTDLNTNIASDIIRERIKGLKIFPDMDEQRNNNMILTKISGVTHIKNKSFRKEEMVSSLNVALKKNPPLLSNSIMMRSNSEPNLGGIKKKLKPSPSVQGSLFMEKSPRISYRKKKIDVNTLEGLHGNLYFHTNGDILSSKLSTEYSEPVCDQNITIYSSSHSQQRDKSCFQKDIESSVEMFEDPLFTPENSSSPDHEVSSEFVLDMHHSQNQNFYNIAYAPIHPGSEAALLFQDLMENVTTNMVDTFTSGTQTLTKKLKNVVPLLSHNAATEETVSTHEIKRGYDTNLKDIYPVSPDNQTSCDDVSPADVVHQGSRKVNDEPFSFIGLNGNFSVELKDSLTKQEFPGMVRSLHELICITMEHTNTTNNTDKAHDFLCHWFEVFYQTVLEIHHDGTHSCREDQARDGSKSLPSLESSHSVCSANTSSDSLHWDSNDIGFAPSSLNSDVLEKISNLFLEGMKAGLTASNINYSIVMPQKTDLLHPMTPSEIRRLDDFYAYVITIDCGLLHYSYLLNALEYCGQHYYLLTWIALMKKVIRNSNVLLSQQLPDFSDDELTRAQRVEIFHNLAAVGNTKHLITVAAQIKSFIVILDIVFLLRYLTTQPVDFQSCFTEKQSSKVLLEYLIKFSHHRSLTEAYLDCWCHYPELQGDILMALLSKTTLDYSHYFCNCGLPLPHRRLVSIKVLEDLILLHNIADPTSLAEICKNLGYWRGYCSISLAYFLHPQIEIFPYILQTCDGNLLNNFLEVLNISNFEMAFTILARITSGDIYTMLCFCCQMKIPFPREKSIENCTKNCNENILVNKNSHLNQNDISESSPLEEGSNYSKHSQTSIVEEIVIKNMTQLWEMVIAKVLCRSGASNTLHLLGNVQDIVPGGVLSRRVFNWCILGSLAEQRSQAASFALLDNICWTRTKLYSNKVFQAIHHKPPQKSSENKEYDMSSSLLFRSIKFPETTQKALFPSQPNINSKQQIYSLRLDHQWGVWVKVLEGVCSCCYLRLSTHALVSEGGLTVFSCGHAFHTICLFQRGHHCVDCGRLGNSHENGSFLNTA